MRKGDIVTYKVWWSKQRVNAIVRSVHRDGSVTVEARFMLDEKGEREGGYVGHKYRLYQNDVYPIELVN